MDKRKLYELTVNSLIFSNLCKDTRWFGSIRTIYFPPLVIKRYGLTDDLQVAFYKEEWMIRKYVY